MLQTAHNNGVEQEQQHLLIHLKQKEKALRNVRYYIIGNIFRLIFALPKKKRNGVFDQINISIYSLSFNLIVIVE